jgi:GNAT superfamily N-acetyltransferase
MTIRRIRPEDWTLLRELRLAALADAPGAFGQRHDEAVQQPDAEWSSTARAASAGERRAWFLAFDESGRAVGLVQGRRRPPADCLLFSMWVAPAARQKGTGRALVEAVSEWGAEWGARTVVLWVIQGNDGARAFYERIGFSVVTAGPDAESGAAYGAIAMARPVSRD